VRHGTSEHSKRCGSSGKSCATVRSFRGLFVTVDCVTGDAESPQTVENVPNEEQRTASWLAGANDAWDRIAGLGMVFKTATRGVSIPGFDDFAAAADDDADPEDGGDVTITDTPVPRVENPMLVDSEETPIELVAAVMDMATFRDNPEEPVLLASEFAAGNDVPATVTTSSAPAITKDTRYVNVPASGSRGAYKAHIGHVLSLLRVNSSRLLDRMSLIATAAKQKLEFRSFCEGIERDSVVLIGSCCAVRFEDQMYYGKVERLGGSTSCCGIIETIDPIVLENRKEGMFGWFRWLELVPDSRRGSSPDEPPIASAVHRFGKYDADPGMLLTFVSPALSVSEIVFVVHDSEFGLCPWSGEDNRHPLRPVQAARYHYQRI
jgi:hypothetical protein